MSNHNLCFHGELTKIIHQLSSNTHLICSTDIKETSEKTRQIPSLSGLLCMGTCTLWLSKQNLEGSMMHLESQSLRFLLLFLFLNLLFLWFWFFYYHRLRGWEEHPRYRPLGPAVRFSRVRLCNGRIIYSNIIVHSLYIWPNKTMHKHDFFTHLRLH